MARIDNDISSVGNKIPTTSKDLRAIPVIILIAFPKHILSIFLWTRRMHFTHINLQKCKHSIMLVMAKLPVVFDEAKLKISKKPNKNGVKYFQMPPWQEFFGNELLPTIWDL